jgi:uncharacterized Zn-binding protein involved in type VI secretion
MSEEASRRECAAIREGDSMKKRFIRPGDTTPAMGTVVSVDYAGSIDIGGSVERQRYTVTYDSGLAVTYGGDSPTLHREDTD